MASSLRTDKEWEALPKLGEEGFSWEKLYPIVRDNILELLKTNTQFTTTELVNAIYYGEDADIKQLIFDVIKKLKAKHELDDCWVKGPQKGAYMGKPVFPPIWGPIKPGLRCPCCNRLKEVKS